MAEKSGPWIRVYANTDIQEVSNRPDAPLVPQRQYAAAHFGWMEARGVVIETTPDGDQVIMGEAANEEAAGQRPARTGATRRRPRACSIGALVEMFPNSPLAPEAAWRAADILWQIQKADQASRPSAKEQAPYMREGMDEDEMKKVIKFYPRTRQAALAAYDMIDNKLCGDWQGQEKCPEKEIGIIREIRRRVSRRAAHRARRSMRRFIARRCWWTCSTPITATRRRTAPRRMRMNWLRG